MEDDKNGADYANLAFNPYAISSDDLTTDYPTKGDRAMENGGYEKELIVENNPHYEDTLEVAKKAGLTGTGRRKKENIVYEETVFNKKSKRTAPAQPTLRASNLPPRPTEEWSGIQKNRNNQWKLPFVILCVLILLCLVGSALGVLAYLDDKAECSCEKTSAQGVSSDPAKLNQLEQKLKLLQAKLNSVETEQKTQFDDTKKSVNTLNEQLSSTIESINSTFKVQLKNVKSNISVLGKDVDEITTDLRRTNNFSQLLSDTVENINSSFLVKLGNISKQIGPRGYNGSQGLQGIQGQQGLQGVGNLSACTVQTKSSGKHEINDALKKATKALVAIDERTGYKIMAAVCSTKKRAGASQTVLAVTKFQDQYKYTCTCAGVSESADFEPALDSNVLLVKMTTLLTITVQRITTTPSKPIHLTISNPKSVRFLRLPPHVYVFVAFSYCFSSFLEKNWAFGNNA